MFRNIFFLTLAAVSSVSSNPLPLQFQPCCQQNCPNSQQNPFLNFPIEIPLPFSTQQLPLPINSYSRPVVTNQKRNVCCRDIPTNQNVAITNQQRNICCRDIPSNQNVANEVNHQIVDKVLSNPLVKAIVENSKYQNPVQNLRGNMQPQVVNNYFIIPSEVLLNETRKAEGKAAKAKEAKGSNKFQNRERTDQGLPDRRPKPTTQWKPQCIVPKRVINTKSIPDRAKIEMNRREDTGSEKKENLRRRNPQQRPVNKDRKGDKRVKSTKDTRNNFTEERKLTRKNSRDAVSDFFDEYYENDDKPQTKRSEDNSEASRSFETDFEHESIESDPVAKRSQPKRRPNKSANHREHTTNPDKIPQVKEQKGKKYKKPVDLSIHSEKDYIGEPVDLINENQLPEEKRKTRNPDEVIIQNVKSKYPGMPEMLVRDLLVQMKQQLQKNQPYGQIVHPYYPYNFYPMNYNPYYQRPPYPWYPVQQRANTKNGTNQKQQPAQRNKSRKNKKQKETEKHNNINEPAKEEKVNNINDSTNQEKVTNVNDAAREEKLTNDNDAAKLEKVTNVNDAAKDKKITESNTEVTTSKFQAETTEDSKTDITNTESPTIQNTSVNGDLTTKPFENTTPYSDSYSGSANTGPELKKLGSEDEVPIIKDNGIGWIEDYYPDFTKDAFLEDEFYKSYPEYYEEEINRNERKIPSDEGSKHKYSDKTLSRKEAFRKNGRRRLYYAKNSVTQHPVNEKEYSSKLDPDLQDKSEELVFKTPPGLESPDFKTMKVKEYRDSEYSRPRYFSEDYDYTIFNNDKEDSNNKKSLNVEAKSSTYSYSKTPFDTTSAKPSNVIRSQNDKAKTEIETFFANSKIVKYGSAPDYNSDINQETTTEYIGPAGEDLRNKYTIDGDTIVFAKSYPEELNWFI